MKKPSLRSFFGHHKCATTWINDILQLVCRDLGLAFANVHSPAMFNYHLDSFVKDRQVDFLAYTNADIQYVKELNDFRGFHAIRDPRDIVVSAYFSHLHSHPTNEWTALIDHRKKLQKVSKNEGLFLEMDFRKKQFEYLYNWDYCQPNVLELKMEKLIADPYEEIAKALSFLNIVNPPVALMVRTLSLVNPAGRSAAFKDRIISVFLKITTRLQSHKKPVPSSGQSPKITAAALLKHIFNNRFSSKTSGRLRGDENVASHYRKGLAGDWINHFTPEHCRYFKERYSDVLLKLGYEKNPDW
jgi:hypothetical protein